MFALRNRGMLVAVVLALSLVVGVAGCSSTSSNETVGDSGGSGTENAVGLPESPDPALDAGRQLIETKCTLCHTLDRVKQADKNQAEWEATIARMRDLGLVITDEEVQQVLDYLESR